MRRISTSLLAAALAVALAGCSSPSSDAASSAPPAAESPPAAAAPVATPVAQAVIHGRATYRERIKMQPGGYVVVQLIDNQLADTPTAVIAQTRLDDVAGPPFDFSLSYDPSKLRANGLYGLRASLYGPLDDLVFVSDARVPFTPGQDDVGEIRMTMVHGATSTASTPTPTQTGSVWDQARARGVTFRGVGNEPGWMVEVAHDAAAGGESFVLRAELDYGERKILVPDAKVIADREGFGGRTADGTEVVLHIERATCSDGMSDETYPAAVKLIVGDRIYSGCGRQLEE